MSDLRSKLRGSSTVIVPARSGDACQTLPNELCLEVLRFSSAYDLGRLGRTGTKMRTLSLRVLTQLPGDWQLRRMPAPDRRVYFTSTAHRRAQWEKPARAAAPPPAVIVDPRDTVTARLPYYGARSRPAPPPRQTGCPPGDWKMNRVDGDVFWFSYNLRVSQWERPCYEDAPLPLYGGQILRASSYYRIRAGSNYLDQSLR